MNKLLINLVAFLIFLTPIVLFLFLLRKLTISIFFNHSLTEYVAYINQNNVVFNVVIVFVAMLAVLPLIEYAAFKNFIGMRIILYDGISKSFYRSSAYFALIMAGTFLISRNIENQIQGIYNLTISFAAFTADKIFNNKNRRIARNKAGCCAICGEKYDSMMFNCPSCNQPYDIT